MRRAEVASSHFWTIIKIRQLLMWKGTIRKTFAQPGSTFQEQIFFHDYFSADIIKEAAIS
jgi:hypothetical protein